MLAFAFAGLDLLSTGVILLDDRLYIQYANPAAETMFALNRRVIADAPIDRLLRADASFSRHLEKATSSDAGFNEDEITLQGPWGPPVRVSCAATPVDVAGAVLLLEFRQLDRQLRIAREERQREQQEVNRELIRNLAHEIRNPLGGIRGAAQLLERELVRQELTEYTGVIVKEADRLQALLDHLLTQHRMPERAPANINEVLDRVRSLMLLECGGSIVFRRDYDVSLPLLVGDAEQLIQAALNIARNAVQALGSQGEITFKTRIARQVTLARKRYRHAIEVQITDNGPGIPEEIRERIFYPLVSGREGGSGLGLSLALNYVSQHNGVIECYSRPGKTTFTILLPVTGRDTQ